MLKISQKCYYAIRAVLELAGRPPGIPTTINMISQAQRIPAKFLAVILAQLRRGGIVDAMRGTQGGYVLAVSPAALTVAHVIACMDGATEPVLCLRSGGNNDCERRGHCAVAGLWNRAARAVEQVFSGTTFQDLIDEERAANRALACNYSI